MVRNQHVVPSKNGSWNVADSSKATKHTATKTEAIKVARDIARNQGSELIIHDKNSKIQSRDSHGKDPFPPKG